MTKDLPPPPDSSDSHSSISIKDTPKIRFKRNMKKFGASIMKGIKSPEFQKFAKGMQGVNEGLTQMPKKTNAPQQSSREVERAPAIKPLHEDVEIKTGHIFDLPSENIGSNLDEALWGKRKKGKR
jgi:hypothetical protein